MILADTSIWIDHLGRGNAVLGALVAAEGIVMHPYVLGEIALGSIRRRAAILSDLHDLPGAPVADPDELLGLIERERLHGAGIGYVDAHLLASTLLMPGTRLWTHDKRLHAAAERLGIAAKPAN